MKQRQKRVLLIIAALFFLCLIVRFPMLEQPHLTFEEWNYVLEGEKRATTLDPSAEVWGDSKGYMIEHAPLPYFYYGIFVNIGRAIGAEGYLG